MSRQIKTLLAEYSFIICESMFEIVTETRVWITLQMHSPTGTVTQVTSWGLHLRATLWRFHYTLQTTVFLMINRIVALSCQVHLTDMSWRKYFR